MRNRDPPQRAQPRLPLGKRKAADAFPCRVWLYHLQDLISFHTTEAVRLLTRCEAEPQDGVFFTRAFYPGDQLPTPGILEGHTQRIQRGSESLPVL